MTTRVFRGSGPRIGVTGGTIACLLFLGVPAFAQEISRHVDPWLDTGASVDTNVLSEEEYREYTSLVTDLQKKLDSTAQEFQRKIQRKPPIFDKNLSALVGDWFRTIDYVKVAQVERPLFLSDPMQIRVHLQVELKSKRTVRDDVVFTLSMQPRVVYGVTTLRFRE